MATGQSVLNLMELFNAELELQSGEVDVTRGLLAVNVAQDYFEALAAREGNLFGDTVGTVATTDNQETTTFPAGLLRLDRLQGLNSTTSRPEWIIDPMDREGSHLPTGGVPYLLSTSSTGRPSVYWTNGRNIYWGPVPDAVYTIRWYGFQRATDITASGTFLYDDLLLAPFAAFATKVMAMGLGDGTGDLTTLAGQLFSPVIETLVGFQRDGGASFTYAYAHST